MIWLKKLLCRHEYRLFKFQALGSRGDYRCVKCGRMVYDSPGPGLKCGGQIMIDTDAQRLLIQRIAQVANAVGFQAGEPAIEVAGQIVSVLAANPEHIERFMAEGPELFIDGTFAPENGSMTYRSIGGKVLSPSVLRSSKGTQQ